MHVDGVFWADTHKAASWLERDEYTRTVRVVARARRWGWLAHTPKATSRHTELDTLTHLDAHTNQHTKTVEVR